jgi:hypothetical protein
MGKLFSKLSTEELETPEDRLGGSAFDPIPSGIYDATIKLAYVGKASASESTSITLQLDVKGKEVRETVWITNREGDNFYYDKNDKSKKIPLPGFTLIDDLCLLTTGEGLAEQDTTEKTIKIYDPVERKELPKPVPVLTALLGEKVKVAILREVVDKQKKDDSGKYVNTGETRTQNTIDKVFHIETGRTVNEYRHEVESPEFMTAWDERNTGKDRNRSKGLSAAGGTTGAGRPNPFSGNGAPGASKPNMFAKK